MQAEAHTQTRTHTDTHFSTLYFSYIVIFHITILLKREQMHKHPVGYKDLNLAVKQDKQFSN